MEQNEDPETVQKAPRLPSPVPARNKVGNGLMCKNRKSRPSATVTSSETASVLQASTSSGALGVEGSSSSSTSASVGIWGDLANDNIDTTLHLSKDTTLSKTTTRKRKPPLLDLNVDDNDDDDHINDDSEPSTSGLGGEVSLLLMTFLELL